MFDVRRRKGSKRQKGKKAKSLTEMLPLDVLTKNGDGMVTFDILFEVRQS